MAGNRGATSLRRRRRTRPPMQDYDALPPELRAWLREAVLPWSPRSVRRAYADALARTGDRDGAFAALERLQATLIARDAPVVWRGLHPCVGAAKRPRDAPDLQARSVVV